MKYLHKRKIFRFYSLKFQVLLQRHMIDGRWCDIKIPESQERKVCLYFSAPMREINLKAISQDYKYFFNCQDSNKDKAVHKIFVGRITENLTKEDIKVAFSQAISYSPLLSKRLH